MARLNSFSAPSQSQSKRNFTIANDKCASAIESSISKALRAASFAFGMISEGARRPYSPAPIKTRAVSQASVSQRGLRINLDCLLVVLNGFSEILVIYNLVVPEVTALSSRDRKLEDLPKQMAYEPVVIAYLPSPRAKDRSQTWMMEIRLSEQRFLEGLSLARISPAIAAATCDCRLRISRRSRS